MTMNLGPYASFIGGSYALVGLVVIALIAGTLIDYRRQMRKLHDLDRAGVSRRSDRTTGDAT